MSGTRRNLSFLTTLLLSGLFAANTVGAQTGNLTGRVIDGSTLRPIAGAQVSIADLAVGSLTRAEGDYSLEVPAGSHQVEVTFIGYSRTTSQVTIIANETAVLDVQLHRSAISLDEIVVTGSGVQEQRRQLGYASGSVTAAELEVRPIQSISGALRGSIAGVQPTPEQGETGSGARIRLRGHVSLSQRNEPLLVIDGVRQDGSLGDLANQVVSRLDDINPDDIERIEVIKGASAATLFGTEASAGVIQVFTKRGLQGAPRYSFSIDQTIQRTRFSDGRNGELRGGYIPPNIAYDPDTGEFITQTPMKDLLGTGHLSNYTLSVSGGTPTISYFVSGRYMYNTGMAPNSNDENISLRTRIDMNNTDKLRTEVGLSMVRRSTRAPAEGGNLGVLAVQSFANPLFADTTNNLLYGEALISAQDVQRGNNWLYADRYAVDLKATYQWTPNIQSQAVVGYNRTDQVLDERVELGEGHLIRANATGKRVFNGRELRMLTADFNTSWRHQLSDQIGLQIWGGGQAFIEELQTANLESNAFPAPGLSTVQAGANITGFGEEHLRVVNAGYFTQAQFDVNNRLFLTGGLRADGNSAFGETVGLTYYPKVSGSYVLSEEPFWPMGSSLGLFRLRAAYGESGLQPGAFDAVQTWEPRSRLGGSVLWPQNVGNPDLRPERSSELEFGADLGVFNDRVGLEFTYFTQTTTDAIVGRLLPPSEGFISSQFVNIGAMESKGVEVLLNWNVMQRPNFDWSVTGTVATANQKVTKLDEGVDVMSRGGFRAETVIAIGHPPAAFRTPVVDPNNPYTLSVPIEELSRINQIIPNRLKNAAGGDSLKIHKGAVPTITGSFSTEVGLRNLRFRALVTGGGGFVMHSTHEVVTYQNGVRPDASRLIAELADPNTPTARRAELAEEYAYKSNTIWGNWIERADFLRLQEVSVSYPVPQSFSDRIGLSNLSVNLAATNLYLWTKYLGTAEPGTPQQSTGSILSGEHRSHLPSPRGFTVSFRGGW